MYTITICLSIVFKCILSIVCIAYSHVHIKIHNYNHLFNHLTTEVICNTSGNLSPLTGDSVVGIKGLINNNILGYALCMLNKSTPHSSVLQLCYLNYGIGIWDCILHMLISCYITHFHTLYSFDSHVLLDSTFKKICMIHFSLCFINRLYLILWHNRWVTQYL